MLIAHISDTHVAAHGYETYGFVPMAENLEKCVSHINNLPLKPDVMLLSGDVTNDFLRAQATRAKDALAKLECPYFLVPGNHDDRSILWNVFGGGACRDRADGFINYVIEDFPVRIIALDSLNSGNSGGKLCDVRLAWLEGCLIKGGERPTIIFMHHPPLKLGVPETDEDGFDGSDRLGDIISRFPNVERILCGHIHLLTHTLWNRTIVTTAPSMGMELGLDLTQTHPSKFRVTHPAYLLHHWTPGGVLVTHTISVDGNTDVFEFAHT
jgi:3',5'-cyclic AMP phosphodiesterase CpdA